MRKHLPTMLFLGLSIALAIRPSTVLAQRSAQYWRTAATDGFPDLAVKGSPFNRLYIAAYAALKKISPESADTPEVYYVLACATSQALAPPAPPAPPTDAEIPGLPSAASVVAAQRSQNDANTAPADAGIPGLSPAEVIASRIPEMLRDFIKKEKAVAALDQQSLVVKAHIKQVVDGGVLCSISVRKPVTTTEYHKGEPNPLDQPVPTVYGGMEVPPGMGYTTTTTEVKDVVVSDLVFISGISGKADDEEWSGRIWPAGTYNYENLLNYTKTVRHWCIDRAEAVRFITSQTSD